MTEPQSIHYRCRRTDDELELCPEVSDRLKAANVAFTNDYSHSAANLMSQAMQAATVHLAEQDMRESGDR